ncbi:hypothetical protein HMP09_0282 [Sphingomonas sp. HMP9]|uniref:hypothetical protein n=1 Tax=Sphingomonas sp. HMP9 TaxID=1517554 RepID=UPI0015965521|nr:hypothetical protein [Sphingomonas sp. HMP9]BCA61048.1 hypothetical protein HMP09_0282 [Sphingomonas sp. HMP9]
MAMAVKRKKSRLIAADGGGVRPFLCFGLLFVSMFVNLILAFLRARGVPASTNSVIAVQAVVTALALPAFLMSLTKFRPMALFALGFILLSAIVTNVFNPFNLKSIYDSLLIPIYIGLGMSAATVRPKWMSFLLVFVVITALLEAVRPSVYVSLFDPAGYFSATREWVANQKASASSDDGFYTGAYRAGGSQFSFTEHRVSGAFLEPLSLGYFSVLMSIYYAGMHRGSFLVRILGIVTCLCLALASDSRISTVLILVSVVLLTLRPRLPAIVLWLTLPVAIAAVSAIYFGAASALFSDTFFRLGITFQTLGATGLGATMIGKVPPDLAGDSGILYMLRCLGPLGMLVGFWLYTGAFTRRRGSNVAIFVMIAVYLAISLVFGGASLSIKTASLLGYLVGIGSAIPRKVREQSEPEP